MVHITRRMLAAFAILDSLVLGAYGSQDLRRRDDVNPASPFKFRTRPDANMTLHDFGVFAENPLSVWDDEELTLTTTNFIPGDYRARMGLANGYVQVHSSRGLR
jgi:hypothetical protein